MDLTEEKVKKEAIGNICNQFVKTLKESDFIISEKAICTIGRNHISIGIEDLIDKVEADKKYVFGSEVEIDINRDTGKVMLSVCTMGSFDISSEPNYWRITHAASFLSKWELFCEIVKHHILLYNNMAYDTYKRCV